MKKIEILAMTDEKLDKVVKIQGTRWDRKRKIPEADRQRMRKAFDKGTTIKELKEKFAYTMQNIRYIVDDEWRAHYNAVRNGKHYGKGHITPKNRAAYKRKLVADGKLSVAAY